MMRLRNFWSRTKHKKTQRQRNTRNKNLIIASIQDEIENDKALRLQKKSQTPTCYVSCYPVVNFQLFSNTLMSTHTIQIHTDCIMSIANATVSQKHESTPATIFISKMVHMPVDRFIQQLIQDDTLHGVSDLQDYDNVHLLFRVFMADIWRCLMYHVLKFGSNCGNKIKIKNTLVFPAKDNTTPPTTTRKVQVRKTLLLQKDCLLFDELTLNDIVNRVQRDCFAQFSQTFRQPCDLSLDIAESDVADDAIENQMFYDRKLELVFTIATDDNFKESVRNFELSIGEERYQQQIKSICCMLEK